MPLRALIRLSDISNESRNFDGVVKKYSVVEVSPTVFTINFRINNNSGFIPEEQMNIDNVPGLPAISREIESVTSTNIVSIEGADVPQFSVDYYETYSVVIGVTTYYYLRAYIASGHTINAGSTILFGGVPVPLDDLNAQELTVFSATKYVLVFRTSTGPPWGISADEFPLIYLTPTPPNIYPVPSPVNTSGEDSELSLTSTNGYISCSLEVATLSPYDIIGDSGYLTDHNRSSLEVRHEEVEQVERTVDGTLRYRHNATKRLISVSWSDLPAESTSTVDGYWSGSEMLEIFRTNKGVFYIEIYNRDSARKTSTGPDVKALVRFSSLDYSIVRRNFYVNSTGLLTDLWDISVTFEEV